MLMLKGFFPHSYLVNSVLFFKLARATVRDPKTGVLTTANYRVSKRYHHLVAFSSASYQHQLQLLKSAYTDMREMDVNTCTNLNVFWKQLCYNWTEIGQVAHPLNISMCLSLHCTMCFFICIHVLCLSAWLEEDDDPVIARVNQRIEDITGLTVQTAELLQVK